MSASSYYRKRLGQDAAGYSSAAQPPPPPPPPPSTLPAHPRVWMTPARVSALQLKRAANTTTWQNVKKVADAQVARGTAFGNGSGSAHDIWSAGEVGLAYLATGTQSYATRAEVVLTNYCGPVGTADIRADSCFGYREAYLYAIQLFDWCYNGLSAACRQQVATWLMDSADYVWPETNPGSTGFGLTHPDSNYFCGFLMTGPAALAAAGDDTGSGSVSGADRPTYHQNLIVTTKWGAMEGPALDAVGYMKDGAWGEGTGYDSSGRIATVADGFATCGISLATPFYENAIRFRCHSTMPGFAFRVPFGDQAAVSSGAVSGRTVVEMLRVLASDATLKAQGQYFVNQIGGVPTTENGSGTLPLEFLYYDQSATTATDLSGLPLYYLAEGPGYFMYRNSWTDPNSTAFSFESGVVTSSAHGGGNCNGIRIWKGGYWLSGDANVYSASGINKRTQYFNNMTLAGNYQPLNGANVYPIPTIQTPTSTLVVTRGQAVNAYGTPGHRTLSSYLRTVVYLPTRDTFLVLDDVTAISASDQKVFRWQMRNVPVVGTSTFTLSNPAANYHAYGQLHLGTGAVLGTEAQMLGSAGVTTSNAVTVTLPTGTAHQVLLTSLQVTSGASAPYTITASSDGTNVTALVGGLTVTIPLAAGGTVTAA